MVNVTLSFGKAEVPVKLAVMSTTAFTALLGLKFLQRKEVFQFSIKPPLVNIKGQEVRLRNVKDVEHLCHYQWYPEAYRLLPSVRRTALEVLQEKPNVDLFANGANHVETSGARRQEVPGPFRGKHCFHRSERYWPTHRPASSST